MKILANDGISAPGKASLEAAGFEVITTRVAGEQLPLFIQENNICGLLVRSATRVDRALIDSCPGLKLIGRAGVGMDNIEVAYAKSKGIHVINTPDASSDSVAELVFAHLFGGVRFLHDANRNMPLEGDSRFKSLKKSYAKGTELRGKTLGILGFGRIGQAVAKIALGVGMRVCYHDTSTEQAELTLNFFNGEEITFKLHNSTKEEVLKEADFITLHTPAQKDYIIGEQELAMMKPGVGIVNAARGGIVDEVALVSALEEGKVSFAGLDVFESEPSPEIRVLMHPNVSLSPHIGAATREAQERIGEELARQIIKLLRD